MVISTVVGAVSANQAASAQQKAAKKAEQTQMNMYNTTRSDLMPYQQTGQSANTSLNNLLSGNPQTEMQQLQQLPGYQFTLNQGLQSVQSGAAARGLGSSGAALRGAADYTTGLADSTYGNQVNRLLSAAGLGESAAAQTGAFGTTTAQGIANNQVGAGNAAAAGDILTGNALMTIPNAYNQLGWMMLGNQQSNKSGLFSNNGLFGG